MSLIGGVLNGVGGIVGTILDPLIPSPRYLVTMTTAIALPDGGVITHKATDYVAPGDLNAYVADARTRWQSVTVADQPVNMAGPYSTDAAQQPPQGG